MSLTIGSAAPDLRFSEWIQGGPIESFEPGHVYVVEFWATWCGPCKATIPHLSKLAKRHEGAVTVIGVDIWEHDAGPEKIKQFVRSMGERMIYPVAIDDSENYMAEAWMRASGRQGIPSSFVVDGDGKIAWIGHPSGGLDEVIDALLAGTYDAEEIQQQLAEEQELSARQRKQQQMMAPYIDALQHNDYEAALAAIDKLESEAPDPRMMAVLRVQAAISLRKEPEALAAVETILKDPTTDDLLLPLGMTIAQTPESTDALIEAGIRAISRLEIGGKSIELRALSKYGLCLLFGRLGDQEKAKRFIEEAISECKAAGPAAERMLPLFESARDEIPG